MKKQEIDVLGYYLTPKMRVMKEEEVQKLLKKFNVTKDMLPRIFHDDPAVIALKAKVGDVIEIERNDNGRYLYYRVVVERKEKKS